MRAQSETAAALVGRLEAHAAVENVRYPGFGALLSFDVADGAAARRVETATRLIVNATSLGGVTSTMESRHRWEGERVPEACCGCRSGSSRPTRSGPTSSRRSHGRSPTRQLSAERSFNIAPERA